MTPIEYLNGLLKAQNLDEDSTELKDLRQHRKDVEALIRAKFPSPTIRYGGSKAKGTMIRDSYDLDLPCYFANDDTSAGDTLAAIFESVKTALEQDYSVEVKASALRLRSRDMKTDFHIDVVPGRFTDDTESDAFLHRTTGDKKWFKTNLDVHIEHVRDSGVTDAIKVMKVWRKRNGVNIKTFVLELIVVTLIGGSKKALDKQVVELLTELAENAGNISVEDPANSNNDLSEAWSDSVRSGVSAAAASTLIMIQGAGWEAAFGQLPAADQEPVIETVRRAVQASSSRTKPWCR